MRRNSGGGGEGEERERRAKKRGKGQYSEHNLFRAISQLNSSTLDQKFCDSILHFKYITNAYNEL